MSAYSDIRPCAGCPSGACPWLVLGPGDTVASKRVHQGRASGGTREGVAAYHEDQLGRLVEHLATAIDGYRAGELDAFDVDEVMFRYSRAAKELWKFCNLANVEIAARVIAEDPPTDWWERGAPRRRR